MSEGEGQQLSWKMRFRPCRQAKKEEIAVRRNPIDAGLIQPYGDKSSRWERDTGSKFRQHRSSGVAKQGAGGEEKEDWERDWGDEEAPNEWYESAAAHPAVDSDRCQDANGGSGGGNISSPTNGAQDRDLSYPASARQTWQDGKRRNACNRGLRAGEQWQKENSKNSQGKDPRTCEENSQEGTLAPLR